MIASRHTSLYLNATYDTFIHLKDVKIYDFMFAGGKGEKILSRILAEVKNEKLNKQQKKAAHTSNHIVYVDAGPGTGKTAVIEARVRYLINNGVTPYEILVLAFNTTVVAELKNGWEFMRELIFELFIAWGV